MRMTHEHQMCEKSHNCEWLIFFAYNNWLFATFRKLCRLFRFLPRPHHQGARTSKPPQSVCHGLDNANQGKPNRPKSKPIFQAFKPKCLLSKSILSNGKPACKPFVSLSEHAFSFRKYRLQPMPNYFRNSNPRWRQTRRTGTAGPCSRNATVSWSTVRMTTWGVDKQPQYQVWTEQQEPALQIWIVYKGRSPGIGIELYYINPLVNGHVQALWPSEETSGRQAWEQPNIMQTTRTIISDTHQYEKKILRRE